MSQELQDKSETYRFISKKDNKNYLDNFLNISFWKGVLLSSIFYIIYLEISPGMGNIWLRPDSDNKIYINFESLVNIMFIYPFQSWNFWKIEFWDLNWPLLSFVSGLFFSYFNL